MDRYYTAIIIKRFTVALLFTFTALWSLGAMTVSSTGETHIGGTLTEGVTVQGSADITFTNSLIIDNSNLNVQKGGLMIVEGDLTLTSDGTKSISISVPGTLIVTGNLKITIPDGSASATIKSTGTLVVGGTYLVDGNKESELNSGSVYMPNPGEFGGGGSTGTLEDAADDNDLINVLDDLLDLGLIEPEDIDNPTLVSYTWEGTNSSDWNTDSNWKDDHKPFSSTNGFSIKVDCGTGSGIELPDNSIIGNIDITSGNVIVKEGTNVTIDGDITNFGLGLEISNSDGEPTSLIYNGTTAPQATINWFFGESRRYWYVGHPVSGVTIANYYDAFDDGTNAYFLYNYPGYWNDITGLGDGFGDPLQGYALMIKDDNATLSYSGTLNNDTEYTRDISTANRDYLIANPYPSYLDLSTFSTDDFDGAIETVFVRTTKEDGSRGFEMYNNFSGYATGSTFIAPGQSFWVQSGSGVSAGSQFTVRKAMCAHPATNISLKSAGSVLQDAIEVTLDNGINQNKTAVFFREQGSESVTSIDSKKRMATGSIPNVYTLKEEKAIAVSILPETLDNEIIPLAYAISDQNSQELSLTFNLSNLSISNDIYLVDKVLTQKILLNNQSTYTFSSNSLSEEDRFEIEIIAHQSQVPTDVDKAELSDAIKIYAVNGTCFVNGLNAEESIVQIYSLSGQLVSQQSTADSNIDFNLPAEVKMFIVKVTSGNSVVSQKVFNLE